MKTNNIKEAWYLITDIILLNFLFLATTLIGIFITFGASSTALFSVMFKLLDRTRQTQVITEYFNDFKNNFIESTLSWLIVVVLSLLLFFNYNFGVNYNLEVFRYISIIIGFQLFITFLYLFPVISFFKSPNYLRLFLNSFLLANKHLLTTILVISSLIGSVFLVLYVSPAFILLTIGLYTISSAFQINKVFQKYKENMEEN